MRFLIIASYLPSILNFRGKLLEAIVNQGFEVHIACPDFLLFPDEVKRLKQFGYVLHEIPMQRTGTNPIADFKTLFNLYRLMKNVQPNYVLAYTIKPVIYGMLAASMAQVPHRFALITGLGYAFQNIGKRSFFLKLVQNLYRLGLSRTEKVFFQNPDDRDLFKQLGLVNKYIPTVVVNGSGVNVQDFIVMDFPKNDEGEIKIVFLLIARLLVDKGVREYATAAQILKQKYPNLEFHLVGWIDENPAAITQEELNTWVEKKIVTYWGKLADVRPAITDCSIYVLPSYREGTPRTVLEAMSMGRAIITTDAPGCRETVVDGVNGYLVEVKSIQSLIDSMEKIIVQPELIQKMGQKSREIALNKYDVNAVNAHMLKEMGLS
ncbi:glycosyltransferase family 4 protein [Acinetobacter modestus]|uniref:glycosyltransferase family 4 protein n=1 Tax=Acinetobacter modestus TaxID=1776740 RepID=UPI001F4A32CB|nr:glycosyltransferase family 4 protein [Acinetobacter modestus]MCH7334186.1 glycosyltransferase family 4 protein [Acinetobacter modestus]MCH7388478.1 glycosyltransferase family 4 protein [Acinetobacter modestus]